MMTKNPSIKEADIDEDCICDLVLDNVHLLTCFDCGKTLVSQSNEFTEDNDMIGIIHLNTGEHNYPFGPEIPASVYFECMTCYNEYRNKHND